MPDTFARLVADRAEDDSPGLWFEERSWTWREVVAEARQRAGLLEQLRVEGPWHVGLAMENTAEHLLWWCAAAIAGATVVGVNPTRRGPELARDIAFTECQALVVDDSRRPLLDGLATGVPAARTLHVDEPGYAARLAAAVPLNLARAGDVAADAAYSLVFTSGTTSAPKAVVCTQGRMARIAGQQVERRGLTGGDVFYVVMPMFHSNAIMAGIAPAVRTGGRVVLRRRFSASAWLPDVRRHGVTFFNYVGKPLHYVLATPERPDDADNPLRIAFGNEASERDIAEFSRRFGCRVIDSFGSSEGEIHVMRTPETPPGSLGVAPEGTVVLDPETLRECPPARFDDAGVLLNAEEAVGEIVNTTGAALFEGYWNNPEAEARRLRHGWVWSGDLAYRDADGFFYFAGRSGDWLRVDGENVATAPIERLLGRFPAFSSVAVLAVPDEAVGDAVLAVAELEPGAAFDPDAFAAFLAAQPDLGTTWVPRYLRPVDALPRTATSKVVKRAIDTGLDGALERVGSSYRYAVRTDPRDPLALRG
ncbi:AMP-binding protein [Nocardioides sp. zg-579]|uniref:AMP-binding protein n=1 Tax=Nocardioides marmotae TaxID=2663857 RepID=A0A6I3JEB6_9ACTN|nr:AMP-binding protein [Nocardioides marmotae]MCR6032812.1 AMP-binding protein [Gordonia jinghuaiqii]MTB96462.1 AMP-binding protein [Nocardioides marmotae]QKE02014.1 AMP-binding protein [Nocardioides marmotae]